MPAEKFLTIDIGKAWTKAFLSSLNSENVLEIEKSYSLPTSLPDFSFTVKSLLANFSEKDSLKPIFVSGEPKAQEFAKSLKADFVSEEAVTSALTAYFKKTDSNVAILDAGASNFEKKIETNKIGKFLSFSINEITLENFLGNKSFRPHTLPLNTKELEIEESFFRNLFSETIESWQGKNKIFIAATGGLISGTPTIYRLASLFLDVLGRGQVAQISFDREFFLPCFGALLAKYKQLEFALTGSWFDRLGAFVSLGESTGVDLDWGYSMIQKIELTKDEIALVPTSKDQKITIEFTQDKEKKKYVVFGGGLGIVIDSREKPLPLLFGHPESRKKVTYWLKQLEESRLAEEAF